MFPHAPFGYSPRMRIPVWLVLAAVVAAVVPTREGAALSRRKACRQSCPATIQACVDAGGKRARCKRQTLRRCRKQGPDVCATTTTTSPGGTTSTGGSTTTIAGGSTTTLPGASTTTTPGPTTTSTSIVVHGCNSATATDLRDTPAKVVTFSGTSYTPACARINAGQSIVFSGYFDVHPLVGGTVPNADPSSPIGSYSTGTMQTIQFPSAGAFPYFCSVHGVSNNMVGAVFVDP